MVPRVLGVYIILYNRKAESLNHNVNRTNKRKIALTISSSIALTIAFY